MAAIDPVSAVANALAGIAGAAQPFIEDHFRQKYEKEHNERVQVYARIMAHNDIDRADALDLFVRELLAKAGCATGCMGTVNISVPLELFDQLIGEVSEGIKKDAMLNNLRFK